MNKEQGTTKRILIVFEFCVSLNESMVPEVRGEWEKRGGRVTYLQGLFRTYRAGGMRFSRLLNLGWMFFWLPWVLLVLRPFKVLVRTTPPGIQIWAALWMKILRIKGVLWLMDYHPEIEVLMLERKGSLGKILARGLRSLDRWSQNAFERVVVPDGAMEETVRRNSGRKNIMVFPTWLSSPVASVAQTDESFTGNHSVTSIRSSALAADATVKILYCGNLGSGHDLKALEDWVASATQADDSRSERRMQVVTVGTGERGQSRFRELASRQNNLLWEHWGILSDEDLRMRVDEKGVAWGLVLMDTKLKGLLSPSKFATYLNLGLPLLYFGPEGTNADRVCREFGAGNAVPSGEVDVETIEKVLDPGRYAERLAGVQRAREFYNGFGAERFVEGRFLGA